jgi:hypothetical protein
MRGADEAVLEFAAAALPGKPEPAQKGEHVDIRMLSRYPRGHAPPLVYMTGEGTIAVSQGDRQILRDYLLSGRGTLLADCGSAKWHREFPRFVGQVLPGKGRR